MQTAVLDGETQQLRRCPRRKRLPAILSRSCPDHAQRESDTGLTVAEHSPAQLDQNIIALRLVQEPKQRLPEAGRQKLVHCPPVVGPSDPACQRKARFLEVDQLLPGESTCRWQAFLAERSELLDSRRATRERRRIDQYQLAIETSRNEFGGQSHISLGKCLHDGVAGLLFKGAVP